MSPHLTLWLRDFSTVPVIERRLARLTLNWLKLAELRELAIPFINDRDTLSLLWELIQPLLDAQATAEWRATLNDDLYDRANLTDDALAEALANALAEHSDTTPAAESAALPKPSAREAVHHFFLTLPRSVPARLAEIDTAPALMPTAILLGTALELDATSLRVLDLLELREHSEPLHKLLERTRDSMPRRNLEQLAQLLQLEFGSLRSALTRRAPLRMLGLIELERYNSDLLTFFRPGPLLREVLEAAPTDVEALLALLIEPAPAGQWRVPDFPHLSEAAERTRVVLTQAAATGTAGVNALFYGPPGTGKTELARALASAAGLRAYQVVSADEDDDGLSREGRLSAYLVAQRLLARRRDAVLIFDEVEDAFESGDSLLSLLRGESVTGRQKGWMNRILEENPVPAICISNRTSGMDAAFLRRFLLPLAFTLPPRSVRRQMAERHLGDLGLSPELLDELAADTALAPAHLGAARRLLDLQPQSVPEPTVRAGIAALRQLLHGAPAPQRRTAATRFDVAYLNLGGGVSPSALAQALERRGHGRLCFYGPPGTGKTAFAEVLAEALDRELVARQASDLLSPYVGETEHNLAQLFREIDPQQTVLLLDEVDSFLADRRQAHRSWERTQVNELLQQMERFPGIFVAATNLMAGLDGAALRRFDFKLHFQALTGPQRVALFAREALGDETAPVPPVYVRHLETLPGLTPGDFATVCRQRALLGETLTPEQFLKRLMAEWRLKGDEARMT